MLGLYISNKYFGDWVANFEISYHKVITIHPEDRMNVWTKLCGNQSIVVEIIHSESLILTTTTKTFTKDKLILLCQCDIDFTGNCSF